MPVALAWLKLAGVHDVVRWQVLQSAVVGTCLAGFPVARLPLWQLAQAPVTPAWSKRAPVQLRALWQAEQSAVVGTWFGGLSLA